MAQRGKPSTAHEYDKRDCCIHCAMYKNNVEALVHVCKQWREDAVDQAAATAAGVSLGDYRRGE
jgi:ABC-type histidine transport system ATPase subunit